MFNNNVTAIIIIIMTRNTITVFLGVLFKAEVGVKGEIVNYMTGFERLYW